MRLGVPRCTAARALSFLTTALGALVALQRRALAATLFNQVVARRNGVLLAGNRTAGKCFSHVHTAAFDAERSTQLCHLADCVPTRVMEREIAPIAALGVVHVTVRESVDRVR